MSISRRDFFVETFTKAVQNAANLVPNNISNLLGIKENKKPLTAEEAAFALANRRRKKSIFDLITPNNLPDNSQPISGDTSNNK
jgi:hypothetical protein